MLTPAQLASIAARAREPWLKAWSSLNLKRLTAIVERQGAELIERDLRETGVGGGGV